VSGDGNSQVDGLKDAVASTVFNAVDAYGWVVPATLLTVLFIAALTLLCWVMDDLPLDLPVISGPRSIFREMRALWRDKGAGSSPVR
jgi:hypothetical protein